MALNISIAGKSLDLNPRTTLEIEEENPFLQLNDELKGDYSLPIEIPLTDTNKKALNHIQLLAAGDKLKQIDNVTVTDGIEHINGILKKEQINGNLNHFGIDKVSMYLLKGWSHFFKDIENKTLADCDFGGDRDYGSSEQNLLSPTFINHVNMVMRSGTIDVYDYAIYPVYNSSLMDELDRKKVINYVWVSNNQPTYIVPTLDVYLFKQPAKIAFFPYLNYVIQRIFSSVGWTVDGFIFSDPDFKKATIINSHYIDLKRKNGRIVADLKDSIPVMKITSFLIALKNRLGWWYDFDYNRKSCTIRKVSDVFSGKQRKDITQYCATTYNIKIPPEKKVYSLTANSSGIELSKLDIKKPVIVTVNSLPGATNQYYNAVYFVTSENRYYTCLLKENSDSEYEWSILSENDMGYLPVGKTDDITTSCFIPTMRVMNYLLPTALTVGKIVIPEVDLQEDNSDTEKFYISFCHGLKDDIRTGSYPAVKFPYASPTNYDLNGLKVSAFSLSYTFFVPGSSLRDEGLYTTFWKQFLDRLSQSETMEIVASFPQHIALQLNWGDTLLIRNVEYIVIKKSRNIPYKGSIKLTLARV